MEPIRLPEPTGGYVEVSPEMHGAVKALGNDPAHQPAIDYIIEVLCGRHRISFVAGVANGAETMMWFEGRRFVGEMLSRMIRQPIVQKAPPPEPPARTATEKVRRRTAKG